MDSATTALVYALGCGAAAILLAVLVRSRGWDGKKIGIVFIGVVVVLGILMGAISS